MHRPQIQTRPLGSGTKLLLSLTVCCLLLAGQALAQETGGIKGRVRSSRGDTIAGATITARQNSVDVRSATSNSKGEFKLEGLEPGFYNFVFDAKGFSSGLKTGVEIKKGKTVDLGDRLYLNVDRGTKVIIQGSVFFKDGTSVPRAQVEIEKITETGIKKILTTFTNYSGEFGFSQPEGHAKYRLTATYNGVRASKDIEVESAAIYRTAINFDIDRPEKP